MPSTAPDVGLKPSDVIIRAGAGSGKTTELVRRVREIHRYFWSKEGRHPKVVISTFTRKATQELSERLLASALGSDSSSFLEFINRPSFLQISTLHGVYSNFLARFGHELEIAPQFQMLTERQNDLLRKKVFRGLLLSSDEFKELASDLLEIVDLKELLSSLALAFPQSVLNRDKIYTREELIAMRSETIKSFHSAKLELVSQINDLGKLSDKWQEFREILTRVQTGHSLSDLVQTFDGYRLPARSAKLSPQMITALEAFKEAVEQICAPEMQEEFILRHEEFGQKFQQMVKLWSTALFNEKRLNSRLSFEDLEIFTLKLCLVSPQSAKAFSEEWDYWMLDEYQDTSPLQVEILEHLIGDKPAFIVGDPQQSIYLFRSARYEVFTQKEADFKIRQAEILRMRFNYRSASVIVGELNRIFPALDGEQFGTMDPARTAAARELSFEAVRAIEIPEESDEAEAVVQEINGMLAAGIPPQDIVVLAKSHGQLEEIAKVAVTRGTPVQLSDSGMLSRKQEVIDVLSLLRFLLLPQDNVNFLRILRSPFFKVPDAKITELKTLGPDSYFMRALKLHVPAALRLEDYLQISKSLGVVFVWQKIINDENIFRHYAELDPTLRAESNIWHLISSLRTYLRDGQWDVLNWIDEISNEELEESIPRVESHRVRLMTIHASKGLQFPHVIVPFLGKRPVSARTRFFMQSDSGVWTLSLPNDEDGARHKSLFGAELLEETAKRQSHEYFRLLYVALTRAEESITVTWSQVQKKSFAESLKNIGIKTFPFEANENILAPKTLTVKSALPEPFLPLSTHLEKAALSITSQLEMQKHSGHNLQSVEAVITGIQVHKTFENLRFTNAEKNTTVPDFLKTWRDGLVWKLALNGHAEWGFVYLESSTKNKISGQIDLWGEVEGQIFIVDYKTGSERGTAKAILQMQEYAKALIYMKMIDPKKPIELLAVFTTSQHIHATVYTPSDLS